MYQSILSNYDIIETSCSQFQNKLSKNLYHFASRTPVNQKLITEHKLLFFLLLMTRAAERGEKEGTITPGPIWDPVRFKGSVGLKGPMRGPTGLHRARRKVEDRRPFFIFIFWRSLEIWRKFCHFPCSFWNAQNQKCVIF